jgi:hypothetical protein
MSLVVIRVLAGFLAGLAAGILLMRIAYKKSGVIKEDTHAIPAASSTTTN